MLTFDCAHILLKRLHLSSLCVLHFERRFSAVWQELIVIFKYAFFRENGEKNMTENSKK